MAQKGKKAGREQERERTIRFSVSLPEPLLRDLDRRVVRHGYASRSELVRDLIRERIVEEKWTEDAETVVGVLAIAYDHHQRELSGKLVQAQHGRFVNILCTTHVHLDHDHCLETIIIRGRPSEIRKIATEIAGLRGVRFSRLIRASSVDL
jgi:CopG family nickel-responsive transcriptional regulator